MFFVWFPIVIIILIFLSATIKIVQEYERGVIFRLGRCVGARGPGLIILIPGIERMQKVDLRVITMDIPTQEIITKDNVTVKVNAVVYFRVVNPVDAVIKVYDHIRATCNCPRPRCAACSASPNWTNCSPSGTTSTTACSRSSTRAPSPGGSRSAWWRSRMPNCRPPCSGPWPPRPRLNGSAGRS